MNRKAFTLAELLAVIAILAIIALIVFPAVNKTIKSSKQKAYNQQVESILSSAEHWGLKNMSKLSENYDNYITIEELKQSGYLEVKQVINPITDEEMNGCIIARYESNQFIYSYQEKTCSELSVLPIITLNGESMITIGLGDTYTELGATATYHDTDISSSIEITDNIDNSRVGTYQVRYNVTRDGKSAKEVTRTVNVIDDRPIITINGDSTVTIGLNDTYTDAGVTAQTYNGTDITSSIVVTSDVDTTTVGTYTVRYNVSYNGKNAQEVTRTVKVVDKSPIIVLSAYETSKYEKSVTIDVTATPYTGNTISTLVYKLDGGSEQAITNNQIIINTEGEHTIEVIATDNEGNNGTITSGTYKIDTTSPTITFEEGDTGVQLKVSEALSYDLLTGVTVTDNTTISTNDIVTTGTLSAIIGEYTITYTVIDKAGNETQKERIITVISDCPVVTIMGKDIATCETNTNDPDGNLRYVGADPDNYVWFNEELWRIIGVFDGQVKIIKNENYSDNIAWTKEYADEFTEEYSNNWAIATLQTTLNGTYLSSIQSSDPTSYSYIDLEHVWNIGAVEDWQTLTRNDYYLQERSETISSEMTSHLWTGAIGLRYPSDYGYSTSISDSTCDVPMYDWSSYSTCYENSWLYEYNIRQWTITAIELAADSVILAPVNDGPVSSHSSGDLGEAFAAAKPVLYLKSDVKIIDGTGDSEDPYILDMETIEDDILAKSDSSQLATNDPDGNLRYVGADPDNYVWFNEELWRIIGVFDGQAKIIKNENYSDEISWNIECYEYGQDDSCEEYSNDWATASLQKELNGTYLSSIQSSDSTSYSYIDLEHVWNIGIVADDWGTLTRNGYYLSERDETISPAMTNHLWTGAIGLMYPSDYGYSTNGDITTCNSTAMYDWGATCYENSWLYDGYAKWSMTAFDDPGYVVVIHYGVSPNGDAELGYDSHSAKPVLYLKSDVRIVDGTGDSEDPFILGT